MRNNVPVSHLTQSAKICRKNRLDQILLEKEIFLSQDVQEAAAGVLWNLAFNPGNARIIKLEGGISALTALCASPTSTTLAKFMSVLALSYLCDSQ